MTTNATPDSNTAANTNTNANTAGDWLSGLAPEQKGFLENKGFKDPASLVHGYINLEKFHGLPPERLIKLPEKMDDAAAMAEVFKKLGRPEKPEEYNLPVPEGHPDDFAKHMRGVFHELGLSKGQAEKLATKWNEYALGKTKADTEAVEAKVAQEVAALKTKWGNGYEGGMNLAKKAATALGVSEEQIATMEKQIGYTATMEFFHNVGKRIGEDKFVGAGGGGFKGGMTRDAALEKISRLQKDSEFAKKLNDGDEATVNEWVKLHEYAAS